MPEFQDRTKTVVAVNPDGTNIGGTGGTSSTDGATYTPGSTPGTPVEAQVGSTLKVLVARTPADAEALAQALTVEAAQMAYNGATLDLVRGNVRGTLAVSAARTAQLNGAAQTNYNARGVLIIMDVTAASGTGGLTLNVWAQGVFNDIRIFHATAAVTGIGAKSYLIYPAAGTGSDYTQTTEAPLPRSWYVIVSVGDASSYTYSLDFHYIL